MDAEGRVFRRPSAPVYYCQRKPKNRKNGVGLGTRLLCCHTYLQYLVNFKARHALCVGVMQYSVGKMDGAAEGDTEYNIAVH